MNQYISEIGQFINGGSTPKPTGIKGVPSGLGWMVLDGMRGDNQGYRIFANAPVDARNHVESYDDLHTWSVQFQGLPYIGMSVLVLFKHKYPNDTTKQYAEENLLLKRYVCVSLRGTIHMEGHNPTPCIATAPGLVAAAPWFFSANQKNGIWQQTPDGGKAGYIEFTDDNWVEEKAAASGFAEGIIVVKNDNRGIGFQRSYNSRTGEVKYWVTYPTGDRKLIGYLDGGVEKADPQYVNNVCSDLGITSANNLKDIVWTRIDPITGATANCTAANYATAHETECNLESKYPGISNFDIKQEAGFQILLQLTTPVVDIEANEDNLKANLVEVNHDEIIDGEQVVVTEQVRVKSSLTVSNVVSMKSANQSFAASGDAPAENDDTKYIRVAEGIKNGKDIISPVYNIATIGGKQINIGISLEWAEWEEEGSAVQSRNTEVEGSQESSYIDNQNDDACTAPANANTLVPISKYNNTNGIAL